MVECCAEMGYVCRFYMLAFHSCPLPQQSLPGLALFRRCAVGLAAVPQQRIQGSMAMSGNRVRELAFFLLLEILSLCLDAAVIPDFVII